MDATQNPPTLQKSYVWGADLSGSLDGAGGVGGLLAMVVHSGANAGTYFYLYDGSGNVRALVNAADGTIAAQYDWGPFGEPLRSTGLIARVNPFRWSTQVADNESDLVVFPRRIYSPLLGRFISRDPLEEPGGRNLYGFVGNSPADFIDVLGMQGVGITVPFWKRN